jgi:hypothetical protein
MYMMPSTAAPSATPKYEDAMSKRLAQLILDKTFGQVTHIYNRKKTGDDVEEEGDVLFDINLYIKRGGLSTCLGRFNSHVPVEKCWFKRTN